MYYDEYFIPYDTSVNTSGDSSERASPEKEIHISGAIACSLMVSKFMCTSSPFLVLLSFSIATV